MLIYHGSPRVVQRPEYRLGNPRNDYGRGFYCTEQLDMSKEWACKRNTDGFANAYQLRVDVRHARTYRDDLFVMDLMREEVGNDDPRVRRLLSA